jgi:hypothetical protein
VGLLLWRLGETPQDIIAINSSSLSDMRALRVIKEGINYYGFGISSNASGNLIRLDFEQT